MATQKLIALGDHSGIPVVPQRHARIRNLLKNGDLEKVLSGDYGEESYRILSVLIPAMSEHIPLWEWEGFGSQEAMDNDNYDEHEDRSPTTTQIVEAFEAVVMVGGADRLGKLMGMVQSVSDLNTTQTQQSQDSPGNGGA